MRLSRVLSCAVTAVLAATTLAGTADAGPAHARTIPAHVFAPYFQAYLPDDPGELAAASGARYLTMGFLHTNKPGECEPYWNGVPQTPVAESSYGAGITRIKAMGGDIIPALGGAYAGELGLDLADSCTDVDAIAAGFQKLVTTYDISRIDLDVEGASLDNAAGIDRRNKAIRKTQEWAAANGRIVEFVYTLGTSPTTGVISPGVTILRNAIANGAEVRMVNIMTFDYYDDKQHDMFEDARTAAQATVDTLRGLYPAKTSAQLWNMVGITEMVGLDDYGSNGETGPPEVFTETNAIKLTIWGWLKGVGQLSFWALARDNGKCPGQHQEDCSGVQQAPWQYTKTMKAFTHR
ncbi:hypothetical protein [Actinocrispum sp. NPDC049592]|uniref:hypothetical protein n=1 Tax=Actinocrispum sp. NPDC049592 TaxID=3154835 RepID=UPI003415D59E